jgi:hypothetical protein
MSPKMNPVLPPAVTHHTMTSHPVRHIVFPFHLPFRSVGRRHRKIEISDGNCKVKWQNASGAGIAHTHKTLALGTVDDALSR